MTLPKFRSITGEQVIDEIKQSNVVARAENLLNLNLISCIYLSLRGITIASL